MGLVFFSLLILVIPGVLFNNFSSSGLNPAFALTCHGPYLAGQNVDPTCQNLNPVGCQLDAPSCSLNGTSIGFLNQASPWTEIVRGNYLGFLSVLTGAGYTTQNAYQIGGFGTSNIVRGQCLNNYVSNSSAAYGYKPLACTQLGSRGEVLSKGQTLVISPASYFQNQTGIHLFQLTVTNASSYNPLGTYFEANMCQGLFGLTVGGNFVNILSGCQYYSTQSGKTTYWYFDMDYDNTTATFAQTPQQGATRSFNYCNGHSGLNATQCPPLLVPVTLQPESWNVRDCALQNIQPSGEPAHFNWGVPLGINTYDPLAIPPISPPCTAMQQSITNFNTSNGAGATSVFTVGSVLLWITGIILFIVASGINFTISGGIFGTGAGLGAGVNRQGTKFAQILGLSLVAFIPLYSEFDSWFTSGILPNGLDGISGIISILITGIFFGGVMWQATQD